MGNIYNWLGNNKSYFMRSSWQVYTDLSGVRQYVGKTGNEKTISPNLELVEWYDNTEGPQTLYVVDIDKFDLSVSFTFMQVLDPNVLSIAWNLDLDTSDPNFIYAFGGSNPNALALAEWRFVSQGRDGLGITLVIRDAICVPNGDWTSGAPGDYANVPVTVRALQDDTISDSKRDLFYLIIDKKPLS